MMSEMNYRYNNPKQGVMVDSKIAAAFVSKERTKEQVEAFKIWASMSKEEKTLDQILQNVQVMGLEQVKQATR